MITCDNAGNKIQPELNALQIPFDSEGNRIRDVPHSQFKDNTEKIIIRCFPHIINLAVKAGLKEVTELPGYEPDIVLDDFDIPVPQSLKENLEAGMH
jgi:hypothetical protein